MGFLDTIGNITGTGGRNPFDPNDPNYHMGTGTGPGSVSDMFGQANNAANRQAVGFDTTNINNTRGDIDFANALLKSQATGAAPSVAQNQLAAGTQANIAGFAGALTANRGLNSGQTAKSIADNAATQMSSTNQQAAALRAQEMATGQSNLSNALITQQGQNIGQAQAMQQGGIQNRQLNDQLVQFYTGQGMSAEQANLAASLHLADLNNGMNMNQNNLGGGLVKQAMQSVGGSSGSAAAMG